MDTIYNCIKLSLNDLTRFGIYSSIITFFFMSTLNFLLNFSVIALAETTKRKIWTKNEHKNQNFSELQCRSMFSMINIGSNMLIKGVWIFKILLILISFHFFKGWSYRFGYKITGFWWTEISIVLIRTHKSVTTKNLAFFNLQTEYNAFT